MEVVTNDEGARVHGKDGDDKGERGAERRGKERRGDRVGPGSSTTTLSNSKGMK
jgi:hypothetical protein